MNDLDWNAVRTFLAIARSGSLTAAARALERSQPTMGRQVDALERSLGVTLFRRGREGMVLTDAGTTLMERAEAMEQAADAMARAASGRQEAPAGTVRLSASRFVSTFLLPGLVAELAEAEPAITVDIVATDEVTNLLRRDADLALRMVRPTQPDLIAARIGAMELGAFAAPSYLQHHGAPAPGVAGLLGARLVGYDRSTLILDGLARAGVKAHRDDFAVRTDDQIVYWRLVEEGAGIGFLAVAEAERRGLVALPLPVTPEPLPVWLAAHRDLNTNIAVRRVADHLKARLPALLG